MIKVWYDSETGVVKGFFPEENNYESIPAPTIEITPEQHQEYFDKGQRHIVQQQEDGTKPLKNPLF